MSRLERLLNLTAALLAATRAMTADEIHRTIPGYPDDRASFKRQFERDKDALRSLGMPIEQTPLDSPEGGAPTVGYRIPAEGYYLRDPGLSPDELRALQLAARTVALEGFGAVDALWKLGATGPATGGGAAAGAAGGGAGAALIAAEVPAAAALPALFDAITESRAVAFTYRGEHRRAVPHALAFRNGHWYLDAHDLDRSDDRSFRVDRIEGAVEPGAQVERPPRTRPGDRRAAPWELGDGPAVRARLLIDAHQAPWAVRHLGEESVLERHPDGSVVVGLDVVNVDAFASFVLGFLADAEILGPADLRHAFLERLALLADGER